MRKVSSRLIGSLMLLGAAVSCSADPTPSLSNDGDDDDDVGSASDETRVLKVASFWASETEQEALHVVLSAFEEQTGATVEVVAAPQDIEERAELYRTSDWDIAQENFYNLSGSFAEGDDESMALDLRTVTDLSSGLDAVFPKVMDALAIDGAFFGLPMNLHRENTLHYSVAVEDPPTTMAELRAMCDAYVNDGSSGPKPLAIAQADWLYRLLFTALIPPEVLDGTSDDPQPAFAAAAELIQHYVDNDCLWIAPSEHGWQEAAEALLEGEALMYIHGDWAKGHMVQLGARPGVDFHVAPAPGSDGAFYYGIDTFVVNESSSERDLAIEFLRIALTPEVQAGFSAVKGSTPGIIFDNPAAAFADESLRATYRQLEAAMQAGTALPVPPWMGNQGGPLIVPLRDGEKTPEEVAADFMTVYPTE